MAPSGKVSLRFIIGKGSRGSVSSSEKHLDAELDKLFTENLSNYIYRNVHVLPKDLEKRVKSRLEVLFSSAITEVLDSWVGSRNNQQVLLGRGQNDERANLVGLQKGLAKGSYLRQVVNTNRMLSVNWQDLTPATTFYKMNEIAAWRKARKAGKPDMRRASRFFVFTGELRSELRRINREMVRRTGVVRFSGMTLRDKRGRFRSLRDFRGRVPLGELRFKLLPDIPRSMLPGLGSGNWTQDTGDTRFEKMLGISGESITKLGMDNLTWNLSRTPKEQLEKRPLLQPVFTYITLFRAPTVTAGVIQKAIQSDLNRKAKGIADI